MKKRKQITMLVTLTVPTVMRAAAARREVRSLVNEQCFWGYWEAGDIKVHSIKPAKKVAP